MALPNSRQTFKDYCLRRNGAPVLTINTNDDQINDRIDEALAYYMTYHFSGAEKIYFKYPVTPTDITNRYITMPDNIIGVVNIFDIGSSIGTNSMFNIRYQIALNDLYTLTSVSMVPYYMAMTHIQFLEQLLVGKQPLRYNRNINRLYIDMDWNRVNAGDFLIAEAYEVVDPDTYTRAWSDLWLLRYGSCLIQEQIGINLSKYKGKLPNGLEYNGQDILNAALLEKNALEKEMVNSWSLPATDMIG